MQVTLVVKDATGKDVLDIMHNSVRNIKSASKFTEEYVRDSLKTKFLYNGHDYFSTHLKDMVKNICRKPFLGKFQFL